ncbi:MAG: hypothetical protein JWM11_4468 [Planctomycetaceae bacterium]|nr:hypothetical protein [Planctomycetaceae bacterium]
MVVNGFSMPKVVAYLGLACFAYGSLAVTAKSGHGQEAAETPVAAAPKATPKAAAPEVAKETAKETPETAKTVLPEVTFSQAEGASDADAASLEPVQTSIKTFAQAFNTHDVKAVSALFTTQAEITNQSGHVTRGRDAVQDIFAKLFTAHPAVSIRFEVQSLRFLSPELAIEEGVSIMSNGDDKAGLPPHHDRYTVTHTKVEDKWLVAAARDWPALPPNGAEQLQQLDWLVGEWVDENGDTLVHTAYHWSADKHYLLSEYSVQGPGRPAVQGTQRIGWDPRVQKLHSWTFDTAGGFNEGLWSRSGDQWIVKITGVAADGRSRSATNILTQLSQDHATYQSRDRVVGGEVLPDQHEVPIVRKPPQPTSRMKKTHDNPPSVPQPIRSPKKPS